MNDDRKGLADLLDRLADGEAVQLGEFSGAGDGEATDADIQAGMLREIADGIRRE